MFSIKSTRGQLLVSFLFLISIFMVATTISLLIVEKIADVRNFKNQMRNFDRSFNQMVQNEMFFLAGEDTDTLFHFTGFNQNLLHYNNEKKELKSNIKLLKDDNDILSHPLIDSLEVFNDLLIQHNHLFEKIVKNILIRGYKDYGLEGKMRKFIHHLEDNPGNLTSREILTLRRHEKDFLLRHDTSYRQKLNLLANDLLLRLHQDSAAMSAQIITLNNYKDSYNKLTEAILKIGEFEIGGLLYQLQSNLDLLESYEQEIFQLANRHEEALSKNIQFNFIFTALGAVFFGIFTSIYLANKRSKPIANLAALIKEMEGNQLIQKIEVDQDASSELQRLCSAFNDLLIKIKKQLIEIEENSHILEQRNLELTKLNSELDTFVYSISHDLRAPLASLKGLINISQFDDDIDSVKANLVLQDKCVKKLDGFIKDVIEISRNSRLDLQLTEINLEQMLNEILETQKFIYEQMVIATDIQIKRTSRFVTDPHRLQIVLNNLISNAIRYHRPDTGVKIDISASISSESVKLKIADNGIGIEEIHLPRIFEIFYRATDIKSGTGLGLYITKEIVEKLGGNIEAQSKFNVGTSFTLTIPNKITKLDIIAEQYA